MNNRLRVTTGIAVVALAAAGFAAIFGQPRGSDERAPSPDAPSVASSDDSQVAPVALQPNQNMDNALALALADEKDSSDDDSQADDSEGTKSLTFDDVKIDLPQDNKFDRSKLPKKIEDLKGKSVRIRGYLSPSFKSSGIAQFVLMRNTECKFGTDAPYHFVVVKLKSGTTIDYRLDPITVEGTFAIQELKSPRGGHIAIYAMSEATAK